MIYFTWIEFTYAFGSSITCLYDLLLSERPQ